ncbi:HAAS signaling domain-containing protein [Planococcus sp. X10-3]|uniref:HAAS signaling domain-containing protein n=1 Tax=Planococcus sp. X10-3 TaxID=3061240 RepID=UPI003BAE6572
MEWIDRYIGEVTRRLPVKEREDIAQELHSTMEDMLPPGYTEVEERELLMKFGDPARLAGRYRSQPMYLIGPRFFDLYLMLLKIIIPIVLTVVLVVLIITTIFTGAGETSVVNVIVSLIGDSIAAAFDVVIGVFFWVTLVFVILEWVDRTNRASGKSTIVLPDKGWTPDDLAASNELMPKRSTIARSEPAVDLIWTAIWVSIYFNADALVGIYGGSSNGFELITPVFNQSVLLSYWPLVVLVIILQVLMDIWKWTRRRWDINLATFNMVVNALSLLAIFLIFRNPQIFAEGFLGWLTDLFGSLSSLNWIIGGIIFTFALFALIDTIQGFRKASARKDASVKRIKRGS